MRKLLKCLLISPFPGQSLSCKLIFVVTRPLIGDNDFASLIISLRKIEVDLKEALGFLKETVKELMKDK